MGTNTFVYIDYFKFNDEQARKRFYGHPMQGKVYKALKEPTEDLDVYKLPLESVDGSIGIVLEDLHHEGEGKWSHKISEITDRNILDFDISVDDLKLIEKEWIDGLGEEKDEHAKLDKVKSIGMMLDVEGMFSKISDYLNIIFENDEKMFLTIAEIIEDISFSYRSTNTDPELKLAIVQQIKELKERRK